MPEGTWDLGLDPETTRQMLLAKLEEAVDKALEGSVRARKRVGKLIVLLTQLDNAARVSEAHEVVKAWLALGAPANIRKVQVRVRKQKRKPEKRMIKIPIEAVRAARQVGLKPEDVGTVKAVKMLAQRLGINTHSLRYAGITKMALRGLTDAIIGKITGHRKLDMIRVYIQKLKARELLDEMVP